MKQSKKKKRPLAPVKLRAENSYLRDKNERLEAQIKILNLEYGAATQKNEALNADLNMLENINYELVKAANFVLHAQAKIVEAKKRIK